MKSKMLLMLASFLMVTTLVIPAFAVGASKQTMDLWINDYGQTIDQDKSFAIARCDDEGTLTVNVHLHKTDQAGNELILYLKVDNGGWVNVGTFTPNNKGNGNFEGTITGLSSGPHTVVVAINYPISRTLYINSADKANSGSGTGISFECP